MPKVLGIKETGYVAQVLKSDSKPFEVHPDLEWVEVADNNVKVGWMYDPTSNDVIDPLVALVNTPEGRAELMSRIRRDRNGRLAECDWRMTTDYPGTDQAAWATYRQALRDLPANITDPANPTWPVKP